MTTEEEEKIKFLPAYPSPLLLSIDTQLLQIPFYFIFSFQIGANWNIEGGLFFDTWTRCSQWTKCDSSPLWIKGGNNKKGKEIFEVSAIRYSQSWIRSGINRRHHELSFQASCVILQRDYFHFFFPRLRFRTRRHRLDSRTADVHTHSNNTNLLFFSFSHFERCVCVCA